MVHDLVERTGLDTKDWGGVDAERSSEVVEIIVTAFSAEVAREVVAYLRRRIRARRKATGKSTKETPLMAVTMRRADGAEVVWHFRHPISAEQADAAITRFAEGKAVKRILGT